MNNDHSIVTSNVLDILFPDGDYSSILNQLSFGNAVLDNDPALNAPIAPSDLELEDSLDDLFSSLPPVMDDEQLSTVDEDIFAELTFDLQSTLDRLCSKCLLLPSSIVVPENDSQISCEGEQPTEAAVAQQNPTVITNPIPQKTNDDQANIMYQMYAALSDFVLGIMSVKQQPMPNYRSRYQSDGSRFLPASRYHPMSINVHFSH